MHQDLSAGFVPRNESAINARRSTSTSVNTTQQRTQGKRSFDALELSDVMVTKNFSIFKGFSINKTKRGKEIYQYMHSITLKNV